jgi:eukaryotic-like serine/threonine-protein kinase
VIGGTRVLGGRYELGRMIGRGGMAEVYAAHDGLLDREVAVKVLRERFREDEAFTARFHDEARHVARLAHPNLVVVFDTGTEDAAPYIVMERIRGRTLQQAMDAGGLTEDRALQVAADVCGALGYAHEHGIVHRDIKPGNVMLAEDGSVKVTDFGIARAMSDETVTATAAVLGTAAYLSPEQAQGRRVDARSDLYSLGVLTYELLTGKVPFTAETPVAVALQHVRAAPTPVRELAPNVSRHAETIVMRLLEKDPDRRYQHADEVRLDLERARRGESPLPLRIAMTRRAAASASPLGTEADDLTTTLLPTVGLAVLGAAGAGGAGGPGTDAGGGDDDGFVTRGPGGVPAVVRDPGERMRRMLATIGLVIVGVAVVLGAQRLLSAGSEVRVVAVPALVGQTLEAAEATLRAGELRPGRISEQESDTAEPGTVIAQSPAPATDVRVGETVDLVLAVRAPTTPVPNVAGLAEVEALARLREAGLVPGTRTREPNDTLPAGTVIGTDPRAGVEVRRGSLIDVVISDGPAQVSVRSVTNRPLDEALERLRDQGLVVDVFEEQNPAVPPGTVIRQFPLAGEQVVVGAIVSIWVSTGADGSAPVDVPPAPPPATGHRPSRRTTRTAAGATAPERYRRSHAETRRARDLRGRRPCPAGPLARPHRRARDLDVPAPHRAALQPGGQPRARAARRAARRALGARPRARARHGGAAPRGARRWCDAVRAGRCDRARRARPDPT